MVTRCKNHFLVFRKPNNCLILVCTCVMPKKYITSIGLQHNWPIISWLRTRLLVGSHRFIVVTRWVFTRTILDITRVKKLLGFTGLTECFF